MLFTPPNPGLSNQNLNALGSQYAAQFGHNNSLLVQKVLRSIIYDAAPAQFFDLMMLNMQASEQRASDEVFYMEMGYGRNPVQATAGVAAAVHPATQVIPVANTDDISVDTIVVYPNNAKGVVTSIVPGTSVTVTPMTGSSVPAVVSGDLLSNHSPVEADAATDIKQYYRSEVIERFNYIQMFVKARRYGKMELYKHMKSGATSNFLDLDRKRLLQHFRTDISNAFWNGERGEVTLSNGTRAKTTGGIYPLMLASGAPAIATPLATLPDAIEDAVMSTMFGEYDDTKFLYGAPRHIYNISKAHKQTGLRYSPNDAIADLNIDMIKIGGTKVVLVPMQRFESTASFPSSWADKLFLLDHLSIKPVHCFTEEMGDTLNRRNGGTLNNYVDSWVSATFGIEFNNPLGCATIDIL
jgi:hypothetical protein